MNICKVYDVAFILKSLGTPSVEQGQSALEASGVKMSLHNWSVVVKHRPAQSSTERISCSQ